MGLVQVHLAICIFQHLLTFISPHFGLKLFTARGECKFTLHWASFALLTCFFCSIFGLKYQQNYVSASSPCTLYISADSDIYFTLFRSQNICRAGWVQVHLALCKIYVFWLALLITLGLNIKQGRVSASSPCTGLVFRYWHALRFHFGGLNINRDL